MSLYVIRVLMMAVTLGKPPDVSSAQALPKQPRMIHIF
jgi:hypothetical protein